MMLPRHWTLLLAAALLLGMQDADGFNSGHYRYGSLSWQQTKIEADGITVQFTLKTAWARDLFTEPVHGAGKDASPTWGNCITCALGADPGTADRVALHDARQNDGALPPLSTNFSFGDGHSLTGARATTSPHRPKCRDNADPAFGKCIEGVVVDSFKTPSNAVGSPTPELGARDMVYVVSEITHKYAPTAATYVAEFFGCCRLGYSTTAGGMLNNANGAWRLRTHIALTDNDVTMETGTAASPYIQHVPFVTAVLGQALNLKLHVYDAANRPVQYRIGQNGGTNEDDFGSDLSDSWVVSPKGNSLGDADQVNPQIDAQSGVITFPVYYDEMYKDVPGYYNLVVVVTTAGPCIGYESTDEMRGCKSSAAGARQTQKITAVVDFSIRLVNAGFSDPKPDGLQCVGLPKGTDTKRCNRLPTISVPESPQFFICNEYNSFEVTAIDGTGTDASLSTPEGVFAIRYRQRPYLNAAYPRGNCSVSVGGSAIACIDTQDCAARGAGTCNATDFVPHFPQIDEEPLSSSRHRGIAGSANKSQAVAIFAWTPACEGLLDDNMYSYQGRHRLDVFGACFQAVDQGGATEDDGKLVSVPKCVHIPVLRCTKPTIKILLENIEANTAKTYFWGTTTYTVPVSTSLTILFMAEDDLQTRSVSIYHHVDHGVPSVGAEWKEPLCVSGSQNGQQVTCNPVTRAFVFKANLVHAGTQMTVCVEAVNDQIECPRYRKNNAAQLYGTYASGEVGDMTTKHKIMPSQASEPHCFHIEVPGPKLVFVRDDGEDMASSDLTPPEDATVVTYVGCPFSLTIVAEDENNLFDLQLEPRTMEYQLPEGVAVSSLTCAVKVGEGVPSPLPAADGVGSCTVASRTLGWSPTREQTGRVFMFGSTCEYSRMSSLGLSACSCTACADTHTNSQNQIRHARAGLMQRVCFDATTKVIDTKATRCFFLQVGKCRYCAQKGHGLESAAESYYTDWLQLWAANTGMDNPYDLKEHQVVNMGALFTTRGDETLAGLAARFRSDIRSLLVC